MVVAGATTVVCEFRLPTSFCWLIVLSGFGVGAFAPLWFAILLDIYSDHEKAAHGLAFAIDNVGTVGLPIVMDELTAAFFWRLGVGFALPAVFVLVIAFNSQTITFNGMAFVGRSSNKPSNHDAGHGLGHLSNH